MVRLHTMDYIALIIVLIGAINWGIIGLANYDIIGTLFGGAAGMLSRIVFTIVGIAGIYAISIFFRSDK